jgi:hypothetical protein
MGKGGENTMQTPEPAPRARGVTRISREAERNFFFYATVVMFLIWVGMGLFGH